MSRIINSETIYAANGNICPLANITIIKQPLRTNYRTATIFNFNRISGTASIKTTANAIDSCDNIIVVGIFTGDFPNGTLMGSSVNFYNETDIIGQTINVCENHNNVFVAKYNKHGFILWSTKISGVLENSTIRVTCDTYDNIIIIGTYEDKLTVHNSRNQIVAVLPSAIGIGTFIIKYDNMGNALWANVMTSTSIIIATDVTNDATNNIITTGYYNGTCATFYNPDSTIGAHLSLSQGNDSFIAKYNCDGYVQWTTRITEFATDLNFVSNIANSIQTLSDESIIVSGWYNTSMLSLFNAPNGSVRSNLFLENPKKNTNAFIIKYSKLGMAMWATRIESILGSIRVLSDRNIFLDGFNILLAVDNSNDIIVTGTYSDRIVTFYSSNIVQPNLKLIGNNRNSMFISKYDCHGTVLFASKISGFGNVKNHSVATDYDRNILIAGYYQGGPITIYNPDFPEPECNYEITLTDSQQTIIRSPICSSFIVKYNFNGRILWAAKQTGVGTGLDIHCDMDKNIILSVSTDNFIEAYPKNIFEKENSLIAYDSNGRIVKVFTDINLSSVFIMKYIDFAQVLKLQPALCAYTTKHIYIDGFNGTHTLVMAEPNVLYDSFGKMIDGIVLLHRDSNIFLVWAENKWTIIRSHGIQILHSRQVHILI